MMLTRWLASKVAVAPYRRTALHLDRLEARENPSLTIQLDYTYDTSGFFSDPNRRSILQSAADNLAARIGTTLTAITPNAGVGDTWTLTTFNPADPFNHNSDITISNRSVATGAIVVYVGAEAGLGGGEAGLGGFGGYSASGSQGWLNSLSSRGAGFGPWGGSLTFDPNQNWNFTTNAPAANQIDLYTVATHELGHVLGFGTAQQYFQYVSGDIFFGPNATAVNGGQYAHLHSNADQEHWQQGLTAYGQTVSMQPVVSAGTRVTFSELDYAVLSDIGWAVTGFQAPTGAAPPAPTGGGTTSPPIPTSPIIANNFSATQDPAVVSSGNGTFQLYKATAGGMTPVGAPVTAFAGYAGSVRVASGDVNGDGVQDIIVAAGAGGGPHVKIFDGATGQLIQSFFAFDSGFIGGIFVAAGDIDHDGRADVIITPDVGGGTHVRIFSGGDPNRLMASFFGIETPGGFLGGSRAATGDINGDGYADLVITAGLGGGSHTAIFDGRLLGQGVIQRLTGDFFAFEPGFANSGINVAVSDIDGDGFGDVVIGGGNRIRVLNGQAVVQQGGAAAATHPNNDFFVGDSTVQQSVRLAGGDFDGNGRGEVLIGSGGGQSGQVFRLTQTGLQSMNLTSNQLPLGVFVG